MRLVTLIGAKSCDEACTLAACVVLPVSQSG